VQEHLDHKVNHRGISEEVRALQMRLDESNALDDLQKHIFRSYAEAAAVMAASGDLSGFRLADIDVERLSGAVHATVMSMTSTSQRCLWIRIMLMRIRIRLFTLLRIRIPILIRLFTRLDPDPAWPKTEVVI
jgi:hypothetical protein